MPGKIKTISSFILFCLILGTASGQNRISIEDRLRKSFTEYCRTIPWEEVFLHTDREAYVAGEEIWFSTTLFDRKSLKPAASRSLVYVEVLNGENRRIAQKRVIVGDGPSPGCILLPDTLTTGNYCLRAYTSYMKNFLPYNCYTKNIIIFNAFKPKTLKKWDHVVYRSPDSGKPQTPASLTDTGLKLEISNAKQGVVELVIGAGETYRKVHSNTCYVFIQTHGNIDMVSKVNLSSNETTLSYPRGSLKSGINQITLFNSGGQPVCEGYTYTNTPKKSLLSVSAPDSGSVRSPVKLTISMDNAGSGLSADLSGLSVSVVPVHTFPDRIDMTDYMILGSEFGISANDLQRLGKLADMPQTTLDSLMSTLKSLWIDWGKITSGKVPDLKYMHETNSHYLTGSLISHDGGFSVGDQFVIMSSPGKNAVFQYSQTDKDGNFSFDINIDGNVNDLVIQPDKPGPNRALKIESSFSENYMKNENVVYTDLKPDEIKGLSQMSANYQVNKIYNIGFITLPPTGAQKPVNRYRFYGKPDIGLVLADYIKLPVMQEVFFELIPGATLKNKRSGWEIAVTDPITNRPYDEPAILMVDGVKVPDAGIIAGIDPELVERIDVVRERYFVGDYIFYGLVNVITNRADFSVTPLPDYAVRMPYSVTEPVPSFTSPEYSAGEKKSSRIPDFRNTVFWAPRVNAGTNGKAEIEFWTSDVRSEYEINIQGVTSDGQPVSYRKVVKVR